MPEIPVPQEIKDSVVGELYRRLDKLDWDEVPAREKTAYYTDWVDDPAIGGELADYYTAEGMRVWLKDGPLKEYARALEGFGSYARYATRRLTPPDDFIPRMLGSSWALVPNSVGEKPMHCLVQAGERRRYVCWAKSRNFRDLVWAAVNKAITSSERPLMVVYTKSGSEVTQRTRRLHERLAEHCALDLAYTERSLTPVPQA
ncbi:hypothetical protein GCM10023148_04100 [Actinokineospora soli]